MSDVGITPQAAAEALPLDIKQAGSRPIEAKPPGKALPLQDAITTAVQQAATADLVTLQTYLDANGQAYLDLITGLQDLTALLNGKARVVGVLGVANQIAGALGAFNTLISVATDAQTAAAVV